MDPGPDPGDHGASGRRRVHLVGRGRRACGPPDSYIIAHHGHTILPDGFHLTAEERLRFRSPAEVTATLREAGFGVEHTWGDWDRSPFTSTSLEMILLARRG